MLPYFKVLLAAAPTSLHPALQRYTCVSPVLVTLPTAAKWYEPGWEFCSVIYPSSTPVSMPLLLWRTCSRVTNTPKVT
jgi:hypothetical protein